MPNLRIGAFGNRKQNTLASQYRNRPALHRVVRRRNVLGALQQRRQFSGPCEWSAVFLGSRSWARPQPLPFALVFVGVPLLIVKLNPMMPALRTDSANLL